MQLIWEGVAEGRISGEDMKNSQAAIDAVVTELFLRFPGSASKGKPLSGSDDAAPLASLARRILEVLLEPKKQAGGIGRIGADPAIVDLLDRQDVQHVPAKSPFDCA